MVEKACLRKSSGRACTRKNRLFCCQNTPPLSNAAPSSSPEEVSLYASFHINHNKGLLMSFKKHQKVTSERHIIIESLLYTEHSLTGCRSLIRLDPGQLKLIE